jgi:hypothetical protein
VAALVALGVGGFVLVYRGPGFRIVRGHGGDVAVTAFLFFVLGLVTRWSWRPRVALVGVIALATELVQLARLPLRRTLLTELTVGSTFDPWDLLAYALGLLLAVAVQRRFLDAPSTPAPQEDTPQRSTLS